MSQTVPASCGRFISWQQLRTLRAWPMSSEDFCLRHLRDANPPEDYFFISHRWLRPWHPDPEGTKLTSLQRCYDAAKNLKDRIASLVPEQITPHVERELLLALRVSLPLARALQPLSSSPWHHSLGLDAGPFLEWMGDVTQRALRAPVWIDSFALPQQKHRYDCSFCREHYGQFLYRIPALISNGTCLVPPVSEPGHLKRGWMIVEQLIATLNHGLAIAMPEGEAEEWTRHIHVAVSRFYDADYDCAEDVDGVRLPLLVALERIRMHCRDTEKSQKLYSKSTGLAEQRLLKWSTFALRFGEDRQRHLIDRVEMVLACAAHPKFIGCCREIGMFELHGGRIALLVITDLIAGILISHCWQLGIKLRHDAIITLVQSCVYQFVRRDATANPALKIALALQQILGARFLPDDDRPLGEEEINTVLAIHEHWCEGRTIDVHLGDFPVATKGIFTDMGLTDSETAPVEADPAAIFEPFSLAPDLSPDAFEPEIPGRKRISSDAEWEDLFSADGIPTVMRMKTLPLWACVAFAVRCFRRVEPFLLLYWPQIPAKSLEAIEKLVSVSESAPKHGLREVGERISVVVEIHNQDNPLPSGDRTNGSVENWIRSQAIIFTAICVGYAQKAAVSSRVAATAENAVDAALNSCRAVKGNCKIVRGIHEDFEQILNACTDNGWRHFDESPLTFYQNLPALEFINYNKAAGATSG